MQYKEITPIATFVNDRGKLLSIEDKGNYFLFRRWAQSNNAGGWREEPRLFIIFTDELEFLVETMNKMK